MKALVRHRQLVLILVSGGLMLAGLTAGGLTEAGHTAGGLAGGGVAGLGNWLLVGAAILAGWPVARQGIGQLLAGQFSIPLLVTVAAAGALIIGEAWEAAVVTFLFNLGGYLEELTLSRTRAALRSLVDMAPRVARVRRGDETAVVPAEEIERGQSVIILSGDRVPVDGLVTGGQGVLDTAALTGEPLPVEIGVGDQVLSGSVCHGGYLEVTAERVGADTTFSRLLFLVAEAQEQKPRAQRLLDRFARWYTPAILVTSAVLFLLTRNAHLALTFLVIGCPGALVMAAPVPIVAGLGQAAKQGVLIKGGERLERIAAVDVVALDKTGTLTRGQPRVVSLIPFRGGAEDHLLALASAAELRSEHHLARAILEHARTRGISPAPAADWRLEPGLGAVAVEEDGAEILVGNRRLLATRGIPLSEEQESMAGTREAGGETLAFVAHRGEVQGAIGISDPIRPEAAGLVTSLKQAGVREVIMLTGDNPSAAARVSAQLGLDGYRAGLLPQDKVAAVRELQQQGRVVAMVGDGVNDAPALAVANVSIAMGQSGTQAAIETADVALMGDRLEQAAFAIHLSRRILAIVRQNVVFAVAVVALLLAGVLAQRVYLGGGMLVHEASVLLVILNGMRLLRRPAVRQDLMSPIGTSADML